MPAVSYAGDGVAWCGFCRCLRRLRKRKKTKHMMAITARPTPAPIPALAPVERPWDGFVSPVDVEDGAEVDVCDATNVEVVEAATLYPSM